jgi:hypothetical protein
MKSETDTELPVLLVRRSRAARYANVCDSTIDTWRRKGRLRVAGVLPDGSHVYTLSDIDAAKRARAQKRARTPEERP